MTAVLEQSMTALAHGNELRLARAAVKREIRKLSTVDGREALIDILLDPGELWSGARLSYVLRMPNRSGEKFAHMMRSSLSVGTRGVLVDHRLSELTERQRQVLVNTITEYRRKY